VAVGALVQEPGHEVGSLEETLVLFLEELVEARTCLDALRG
jgi:hypothetical protein